MKRKYKRRHTKPYHTINNPATNVEMILNYIEVRLNRVAVSDIFKPLKRGDMRKLDIGLRKIIRKFKKKIATRRGNTDFCDVEISGALNEAMDKTFESNFKRRL